MIVVGAPRKDGPDLGGMANAVPESGVAYVFERSSVGSWEERAVLRSLNPGQADSFGVAVDVADGFIVVGADGEDGPEEGVANIRTDSGAVYAF